MSVLFEIEMELSEVEQGRLAELETVIDRGQRVFVEVGNALLEIRSKRLYRENYGTFEDYCRGRWSMSNEYARLHMRAAEVVENLSQTPTIVGVLPTTESQARPLAQLAPEIQPIAWNEAVSTAPNGKVTAAHVADVARRFVPPVAPDEDEQILDDLTGEPDGYDWTDDEPGIPEPETTFAPAVAPEPKDKMAVHYSSETPEHYTPAEIIDSVIAVLGRIDLDPCSNSIESPNVPAALHYTTADNGLIQPWYGSVYMNPPYGRQISEWINKLCNAYEAGDVIEAIALVPGRIDTQWWQRLNAHLPVLCFVTGRLVFVNNGDPAPFPSVAAYFGPNPERFFREFKQHGDIYRRLIQP